MKIAHLTSVYLPTAGGAQVCLHNIAKRHSQQGWEVAIILPFRYRKNISRDYKSIFLWPLTMTLLVKAGSWGKRYLLWQLRRIQRKYQFDLWQVTVGYPLGTAAIEFFRRLSIPCLLRCTGEDIQRHPSLGYGARRDESVNRLIRETYPKFDGIVALSGEVEEECVRIGVERRKIFRIPNGVDTKRFQRVNNREGWRRRLGLTPGQRLILTVGRHHPKKGFEFILPMIKELKRRRMNFKWLLLGEGCKKIWKMAEEDAGSSLFVVEPEASPQLNGEFPTEEIVEAYQSADLFVLPTLLETFGMVLLEAMAAGLPVVTTDAPGAREVIVEGKTGFKAKAGDAVSLAKYICLILKNKRLCQRLRKNSLLESKMYDWNKIAEAYAGVYRQIAP